MCKKFIAFILSFSILVCVIAPNIYAASRDDSSSEEDTQIEEPDSSVEDAVNTTSTVYIGSTRTVKDVVDQFKFSQNNGHGFAAEQGNNFIDNIKGHNAQVVGDFTGKDGADRIIIGRGGADILIQDKYYKTAKATLEACFNEDGFRYLDGKGNPMQIEVPSDQYDDVVRLMENKIKEGKIPNVTDPAEAKSLVRKGSLTYDQAVNLAKSNTITSLKYDAANGAISAVCAFGISTLINYAVLRINGESRSDALKDSAIDGVKTGIGVFCIEVIARQLSRSNTIANVYKPSSEALVRALGDDFANTLIRVFEGRQAVGTATQAAKLLRGQVIVAVVTTIVLTIPDFIELFRGRISEKQFVKNFVLNVISIGAGIAIPVVGAAIGNNIYGGVGGVVGFVVGVVVAIGAGIATDKAADLIVEDDAHEMYKILETEFSKLCEEYLITEVEAQSIIDLLNKKMDKKTYGDMYQSKDRSQYAKSLLTPLFESVVAKREKIDVPTEDEMRTALKDQLQGVVFVH